MLVIRVIYAIIYTDTETVVCLQYTESMLYDQLCFYKHIFDLSRRPKSGEIC